MSSIHPFEYWEIRKIGEANNEWAHIKVLGRFEDFDEVSFAERYNTVTLDGKPFLQLIEIDDLVERLSDLKRELL